VFVDRSLFLLWSIVSSGKSEVARHWGFCPNMSSRSPATFFGVETKSFALRQFPGLGFVDIYGWQTLLTLHGPITKEKVQKALHPTL